MLEEHPGVAIAYDELRAAFEDIEDDYFRERRADIEFVGDRVIKIPPSLLVSALSVLPDVRKAVTMDLKEPGNLLKKVKLEIAVNEQYLKPTIEAITSRLRPSAVAFATVRIASAWPAETPGFNRATTFRLRLPRSSLCSGSMVIGFHTSICPHSRKWVSRLDITPTTVTGWLSRTMVRPRMFVSPPNRRSHTSSPSTTTLFLPGWSSSERNARPNSGVTPSVEK